MGWATLTRAGRGDTPESSPSSARSRTRLALPVGRITLLSWGGSVIVAAALADRLIFLPPPASYEADLPGYVELDASTGERIAARYVEHPDPPATVIFAHGNAEDVGHGAWFQDRYAGLGVSVLAFDYPGYGGSSGRPSEKGAYAAIDAAYDFLVDVRGVDPSSVIVHGRSLGGAVAVDLASRKPVGGLVIESSFVSAYRVMTRIPVLPLDQFTSLPKLSDVTAPVLVIHGQRDEIIAPWHGKRLFGALPEGRRHALWVERAGHNDLAAVAGATYWTALRDFAVRIGDALR